MLKSIFKLLFLDDKSIRLICNNQKNIPNKLTVKVFAEKLLTFNWIDSII